MEDGLPHEGQRGQHVALAARIGAVEGHDWQQLFGVSGYSAGNGVVTRATRPAAIERACSSRIERWFSTRNSMSMEDISKANSADFWSHMRGIAVQMAPKNRSLTILLSSDELYHKPAALAIPIPNPRMLSGEQSNGTYGNQTGYIECRPGLRAVVRRLRLHADHVSGLIGRRCGA